MPSFTNLKDLCSAAWAEVNKKLSECHKPQGDHTKSKFLIFQG